MITKISRLILIASIAGAPLATGAEPGPQPYVPQKVSVPKDAPYVLSDGSIFIAGNDLVAPLLEKLNEVYSKAHPGFKFKMTLLTSGMGISGILFGKSAFGPLARDATFQENDAFASVHGYQPTDILIGWDNNPDVDHYPPNGKFPPGVWVNARNPIPALTLEDVTAIFTTGSGKGDITRWGQISFHEAPAGNNGADYAKREIHVYLPALRGLPIVSTTRLRLGGGLAWTRRAEYLPMMEDVVNAVANDPFGIGFIGWFPTDEGWDRQAELGSKVRLLPLAETSESRTSHGGSGDLYPLAGGLHIVVNRPPGKPLEPWLREYLRLALSKDGQDIIASLTKTSGFLPLDPDDIARELAKLQ
jgi:phosphate transport system substrate-binding protein